MAKKKKKKKRRKRAKSPPSLTNAEVYRMEGWQARAAATAKKDKTIYARWTEHQREEFDWDYKHRAALPCAYCDRGAPATVPREDDTWESKGSYRDDYYDMLLGQSLVSWHCLDCHMDEVTARLKAQSLKNRERIEAELRAKWKQMPSPVKWIVAAKFQARIDKLEFVDMRPYWEAGVQAYEKEEAEKKAAATLKRRLAALAKAREAKSKKSKAKDAVVELVEKKMKKGAKQAAKKRKKFRLPKKKTPKKPVVEEDLDDMFIL